DFHGDAVDVEAGEPRHVDDQVGRLAAVVADARVADDDLELIAVAAELEGVDTASEAAADVHFGLVPDAHLDAAFEVGDLDLAVGVERAGFVDGGRGQRRGGQGRQQQRQEEAEGHGDGSVQVEMVDVD